ncbi:hypothetical protein [Wolbachia endosymbiont of Chrysomya megacephala]|uniref:hypothetical protein n=1 Tax=Wolbachia endosymbiont of Chrysomya megacephala TaxID=1335053 RepID=UPI001FE2B22D|nr:hypothetical protein [Wolbachia endosymbiont of Chrysomya megacephala]
MPYGSNNKVRKLMAEYVGIDKQYIMLQAIFTLVASTTFLVYWCCVPTAVFALATCFFVKNAVHAAFSAKELSPEFAEIITEKVVNNVELNAEDNSQSRSYLYETVLCSETRFHFYTPR